MIHLTAVLLILGACKNPKIKNELIKSKPESAMSNPTSQDTSVQIFNLDTINMKIGQIFYQCPMDLEVITDKAGTCPICGMDLEANTKW